MEAILKFNLPEEEYLHYNAVNGSEYRRALRMLDEKMRSWIKHGHHFKTVEECLEYQREMIREDLEGVELY